MVRGTGYPKMETDISDSDSKRISQQPTSTSIEEIETAIQDRNVDIDDWYMNISDRDIDIMYGNIDTILQSWFLSTMALHKRDQSLLATILVRESILLVHSRACFVLEQHR